MCHNNFPHHIQGFQMIQNSFPFTITATFRGRNATMEKIISTINFLHSDYSYGAKLGKTNTVWPHPNYDPERHCRCRKTDEKPYRHYVHQVKIKFRTREQNRSTIF